MLERLNELLWSGPVLSLMLVTGAVLTVRSGFVQLRLLPASIALLLRQWKDPGRETGTTPMRALCTALAATVGTGNIAGVAGAIAIGGPGAVFWMWLSGLLGMATKFCEAALAVYYSRPDGGESRLGGPMYIMERGLGRRFRPVAKIYSLLALAAAWGVGNTTQISAFITAVDDAARGFGTGLHMIWRLVLGLGMAVLVWTMIRGGSNRIGQAAELLVPFASALYILLGLGVMVRHYDRLIPVLGQILTGAFSPRAITGGAVGSVWIAVRIGVSRGVFTNEAGMGTAAMAHAGAWGISPREQGMLGIVEVFVDTLVICTITAFVILLSGVPIPFGQNAGAELTAQALALCYGNGARVMLSLCLGCFALATVLGWGLYAGRCLEYLTGGIPWRAFALIQALGVLVGAVADSGWLWSFSELANGMMAVPNLVTLLCLSGQAAKIALDSSGKICYDEAAAQCCDFGYCEECKP